MKRVCLLFSLFLFAAGSSFSSLVTYEFTARIDSISGQYGAVDVIAGQSVSGWFNYDDAVPNSYIGTHPEAFGTYPQRASMSLVLGSQTISCLNRLAGILVHNPNTPGDYDSFHF